MNFKLWRINRNIKKLQKKQDKINGKLSKLKILKGKIKIEIDVMELSKIKNERIKQKD